MKYDVRLFEKTQSCHWCVSFVIIIMKYADCKQDFYSDDISWQSGLELNT